MVRNMNFLAPLFILFLAFQFHSGMDSYDPGDSVHPVSNTMDHSPWTALLMTYVDAKGNVNYREWQKNPESLNRYLASLAENSPQDSWTKNQLLAYYINLYNAATIKLILEHYPLNSIKDISRPWGKARVRIGAKMVSLRHIENEILRKMDEPRIHFAINCASNSCPKLLKQAYKADLLEAQLEEATRGFIRDPERNRIATGKLQLSAIFKWYKKDFTRSGSLQEYIAAYTSVPVSPQAEIDYLTYDWSLNETKE